LATTKGNNSKNKNNLVGNLTLNKNLKNREESAESVLKPINEETRLTKYLGLDCEMVGV